MVSNVTKVSLLLTGVLALLFGLALALRQRVDPAAKEGQPGEGATGNGPEVRLITVFWLFCLLVLLVAAGRYAWAYFDASAVERAALLSATRSFAFLFLAMLAGMLASVIVASAKAGLGKVRLAQLLIPLACSVLVFGSFWAGLSARSAGPMELLAAFESGFGWELFLNRASQPGGAVRRKAVPQSRGAVGRG